MPRIRLSPRLLAGALAATSAMTACRPAPVTAPAPVPASNRLILPEPLASLDAHNVVPAPESVVSVAGAPFVLAASASIVVPAGDTAVTRIGAALATLLRPATGFPLLVAQAVGASSSNAIVLQLGGPASLGDEGYEITIDSAGVRLVASRAAGLFRAVQTLRQLLPAGIESPQSSIRMASAWSVPAGHISDRPRFAWRGGMLDVARHFFTVDEVKQYIDLLALYKLNVLHLHLSDDQGWRIQIDSWPKLATVGGASEVGGGAGGYYTKADYADIVRYAQDRYITVVPEIDMPAHINAALAAYPELSCSRPVPSPSPNAPTPAYYTGIHVGWSALCPDSARTFAFADDVIRELAAMTPGQYIHMGGDEVQVLTRAQYVSFVERMQGIVAKYGKTAIGWEEIGRAKLLPGTVAQQWQSDAAVLAAQQGAKIVLSPGPKAYMDQRYTPSTELGLNWAGFVELRQSYDWDPATYLAGVGESSLLGVEGPLWSETVRNISAAEYLLVPRLPALAEVGWTSQQHRDWASFRTRIAAHAPRWRLLGINYYPSAQVDW